MISCRFLEVVDQSGWYREDNSPLWGELFDSGRRHRSQTRLLAKGNEQDDHKQAAGCRNRKGAKQNEGHKRH